MINMNDKKTRIIIGIVLMGILATLLVYRDMRSTEGDEKDITTATSTKDILKDLGVSMTGDGSVKVESIEEKKLPKSPDLNRSTDYKNTLTPEVKTVVLTQLNKAIADIKKNNFDVNAWIMLGVDRKTLGDYEGARDAWEYAKLLAPNEVVAYNNLGDLYHYYLKNTQKSEENWKKTIAIKPDYIQGYRGLVDLYKYSMTEKLSETPVMLSSGIAQNKDSIDLRVMLARYYQDTGDIAKAKSAYQDAIATAERLKNTTAVTSLTAELAKLK